MRALPTEVKQRVKQELWRRAEALDWTSMTVIDKAKRYDLWTEDQAIGGVLGAYMDPRKVRIYIKDTLMKPYARAQLSDRGRVLRNIGIDEKVVPQAVFERPHGLLLPNKGVISWGNADDWKLVLMATHERAFNSGAPPWAAVLLPPLTRFLMAQTRLVVQEAARRLGIERLVWIDPHGTVEDPVFDFRLAD